MSTPYFYIIKRSATGERYAGSRWSKKADPSDLLKTYFTSSKTIQRIIEAEGASAFEIERVETEFGEMTALEYETRFLSENNGDGWLNCHQNAGFNGKFGAGHPAFHAAMNMRWGVDFPAQHEDVKAKTRSTWDKKYGGHPNKREKRRVEASVQLKAMYADGTKKNPMSGDAARKAVGRATRARRDADPISICPHCGKEGKGPPMFRWHFDKCREKK